MNALRLVLRLRLLCCRLAIALLWIVIFVGMAAAERTCGSDFDDVASSALLAPTVVEGRVKRVLYQTGEPNSTEAGVSAVFDHLRLYKGQLMHNVSSIEVGYFGISADAEACVAPVPDRRLYILFLRQDNIQTDASSTNVSSVEKDVRRRRERYRLSAFPVRRSRRNLATVLEYTNCTRCGMWHVLIISSIHFVVFSTLYNFICTRTVYSLHLVVQVQSGANIKSETWITKQISVYVLPLV